MDVERLKQAAKAAGGGWLPALETQAAVASGNIAIGELMLELIPLASAFSRPTLSGFRVGAVAQGLSGALYFGANLEFAAGPLSLTVHAEQSAVANAIIREHVAPVRLAVSAAPCGYCRQFLFELASAGQLQILLAGRRPEPLVNLLPHPFGPSDLGAAKGMPDPESHRLECQQACDGTLAGAALQAAQAAYAPYTGALAGVALAGHGRVFTGPYLENAAFNPSLSPMQTAIIATVLSGECESGITEAVLVQVESSKVDHATNARLLLKKFAPGVPLREFTARPVREE